MVVVMPLATRPIPPGYVLRSGVLYPIKRVQGTCNGLGDNIVVPLVAGKKIQVGNYEITPTAAVTVAWKSGAATTLRAGIALLAGTTYSENRFPDSFFLETAVAEDLVLNLGLALVTAYWISYIEVA